MVKSGDKRLLEHEKNNFKHISEVYIQCFIIQLLLDNPKLKNRLKENLSLAENKRKPIFYKDMCVPKYCDDQLGLRFYSEAIDDFGEEAVLLCHCNPMEFGVAHPGVDPDLHNRILYHPSTLKWLNLQ